MIDKKELLEEIEKLKKWLVDVRRDFHQFPELSTQEARTRSKIIAYLEEMEIPYRISSTHHGVVGIIEGEYPGKVIALRADMDALPIEDQKDTPYRSVNNGVTHACGHDAHMTILLGAAKILKDYRSELKGSVKLIFQPAEETIGGAKPMIEEGVLREPDVDAIFGLHVSPEIPVGKIGIKYGYMNGASDSIVIHLKGKSSHGAYPQDGIDAVVMAAQTITMLQSIISRNVDPRDGAVLTIGTIAGGTQANIIPEEVTMRGTIRSLSQEVREKTLFRVNEIVQGVARGMGGKGEVLIEKGYPVLINNNDIVDMVRDNGRDLLGESQVVLLKNVSLGVEDFAFFLEQVPGAFYRLGSGNPSKGIVHPGHSNLFDIDEDCLTVGVLIQVANVLKALEDFK